jgi:hypothetical protein
MNPPKVYDAKGRVLGLGSLVERWMAGEQRGGGQGIVTWAGQQVDVTWYALTQVSSRTYATERVSLLSRARSCPDLLLITDEEKGNTRG